MTTSVRYKEVTNTTGAPLTAAGISDNDGDDRQYKVIIRVLSAADIGGNPGQTQDPDGALIYVSRTARFKEVFCSAYRNGKLLDGLCSIVAMNVHISEIFYGSEDETDNLGNPITTIVVSDQGDDNSVRLQAGDIIIAKLIIGGHSAVR